MDPSESSEKGGGEGRGGSRAFRIWIALCCCWIFYLVISFLSSLLFGFVGLAIERFSSSGMFSVPSTCRILATSVDLRSTEVCETGILNHKDKNIFYYMKKAAVHCHSDYYWASVYKNGIHGENDGRFIALSIIFTVDFVLQNIPLVEYEEYFSGQMFLGVAEAPREALPHDCRPDFGTAWLTASKFKVNETYSCSYLLGSQKVDIYSSDLFDCQAKEPSIADTIKGYYILFRRLFSKMKISGHEMYVMSGAVVGMLISIFTITITKCLHILTRIIVRKWSARRLRTRDIARQLQRVCLLLAYFSAITWLSLQYCRLIGLKHLLYDSNITARTV